MSYIYEDAIDFIETDNQLSFYESSMDIIGLDESLDIKKRATSVKDHVLNFIKTIREKLGSFMKSVSEKVKGVFAKKGSEEAKDAVKDVEGDPLPGEGIEVVKLNTSVIDKVIATEDAAIKKTTELKDMLDKSLTGIQSTDIDDLNRKYFDSYDSSVRQNVMKVEKEREETWYTRTKITKFSSSVIDELTKEQEIVKKYLDQNNKNVKAFNEVLNKTETMLKKKKDMESRSQNNQSTKERDNAAYVNKLATQYCAEARRVFNIMTKDIRDLIKHTVRCQSTIARIKSMASTNTNN